MHMENIVPAVDGGRDEKLLAARKKLKQFQSRRHSSARSYGGDNENRRQHYGDYENQSAEHDRGRHYHFQQQKQADASQAAEGRPLSECYQGYSTESLAESTASTTKATKKSRARRISASSNRSRYLETPEPVRVSIPPEQQEILFKQSRGTKQIGGLFYHDEQRSPFQRVKRESESSDATIHSPSRPSDVQFHRDSTQNEFSSSSSTETETTRTDKKDRYGQTGTNEAAPISLVPMPQPNHPYVDSGGVVSVDETQKENIQASSFNESRTQRLEPNSPYAAPVRDTAQSQVWKNDGDERVPLANSNFGSQTNELPVQNSAQQTVVEQQEAMIQQLTVQLQQLHGHYAQLHTAYSEIVQQQQSPVSSGGADPTRLEMEELRRQIQLHLHTMSVLVDEKTDLQSQLRQAMEIANQKHFESEELQGRLKANRDRLMYVESDLETIRATSGNLEDTLRRQAAELERLRRESAQWQARATEAQQDRSEMNAKLKVRSREVDDLAVKLKDVEKQLHLKEIYIQQLTGGPAAQQQQQILHDELEQQRAANADLCAQLENAKKTVEHWRWETEQNRERYDAYIKQLNDNVTSLAERLEQSEKEKYHLQLQCDHLQKQQHSSSGADDTIVQNETTTKPKSAEDLEVLKAVLNEFEHGLKAANAKTVELESQLAEKEGHVNTLTETLNDRERQLRQLNEELNEKFQHDDSSKHLLEQLHNEKATVSRAVAQNVELKKQLVELQEKFVLMTETNMEHASKLESAERQTAALAEKLTQQENDMKVLREERTVETASSQQQQPTDSTSHQSFDRSRMEDQIRHYQVVQEHFDAELERSQREIGHLKVQNADLNQRLVVLNDANKKLQNEMEGMMKQLAERNGRINGDSGVEGALNESEDKTNSEASVQCVSNEEVTSQLSHYERELSEAQRRLQHLSTENAELHRIMEQNAEDENQNTIRVELHQALNRSTTLSNDNEQLRRRVQELEAQLATGNLNDSLIHPVSAVDGHERRTGGGTSYTSLSPHHPVDINGDDRSSVCSEHYDQRREAVNLESFENLKSAMEQLQQRFAKAMNENADLADQNQQLEHLITHLQSETETIGEYITIYQHQRRTIRERLKEKEEYVAKLSREKEEIQEKLSELQQLIVRLLRDRGSLKQYSQLKPVYGRPPSSPPSVTPRTPRALSQTVVDEVTGSETSPDTTTGGQEAGVETAVLDAPSDPDAGNVSPALSEASQNQHSSPDHVEQAEHRHHEEPDKTSADTLIRECLHSLPEDDATAERILRLLTEMRRPDLINLLPPVDRSLHCKYCTGRLIML